MANKRIELEQYKYYIDLLAEEPSRKNARRGIGIVLLAAMLLATAFLVVGMLSNNTAANLTDIMKKPPGATPSMDDSLDQTTIPGGETTIPGGETTIPGGTEMTIPDTQGTTVPESRLQASDALAMAPDASDGALLAQAESSSPGVVIPSPDSSSPDSSSPSSSAPKKSTGPGKQTRGAASLSKLAGTAGGRGFQIYLLVMFVALIIVLYLAYRRVRREAKAK